MMLARHPANDLGRVEGLAIVSGAWMLLSWAAAVPLFIAGLPATDAFFESMSGLTTTGATVIRDFSEFGRGIIFWRSLTHWFGGMGVIALFVAVLPRLGIGGRQLFFAEAAGPTDEKLTPQIRETAKALWVVYAGSLPPRRWHWSWLECRSTTVCVTPWRPWPPAAFRRTPCR
jgi:trk system potassium uptake protein TrkH